MSQHSLTSKKFVQLVSVQFDRTQALGTPADVHCTVATAVSLTTCKCCPHLLFLVQLDPLSESSYSFLHCGCSVVWWTLRRVVGCRVTDGLKECWTPKTKTPRHFRRSAIANPMAQDAHVSRLGSSPTALWGPLCCRRATTTRASNGCS